MKTWGAVLWVVLLAGAVASADQPNILFIGDSHSVGTFGKVEDSLLRGLPGFGVATYASCGSSPDWWTLGRPTTCGYMWKDLSGNVQSGTDATTPLISTLLAQIKPMFTVVEQGTNLYGAPLDYASSTSQALAQAIVNSGSKCIWIGPPTSAQQDGTPEGQMWDAMTAVLSPLCQVIDSRPYTYYPATGGDGTHYDSLGPVGVQIATDWANQVFVDYEGNLLLDQ